MCSRTNIGRGRAAQLPVSAFSCNIRLSLLPAAPAYRTCLLLLLAAARRFNLIFNKVLPALFSPFQDSVITVGHATLTYSSTSCAIFTGHSTLRSNIASNSISSNRSFFKHKPTKMASSSSSLSNPEDDESQLPPSTTSAQCPLLRLASETIHQICKLLKGENDPESLANLRMTCRGLKSIPEEYLFDTVYLDRRFDSLQRLEDFSNHQHLRQYAKRVKVELELAYERLDRRQWNERVRSFGDGTLKKTTRGSDEWLGETYYDAQLAQLRDSMSSSDVEKCWDRFQHGVSQQEKLKGYSLSRLMDLMEPALFRFEHINSFSCWALCMSKYALRDDDDMMLKSHRETLACPCQPLGHALGDPYDKAEQEFRVIYATACIRSFLQSGAMPFGLSLFMAPWEVLANISEPWRSPASMPGLEHLFSLTVSPNSLEKFDRAQEAKAMATVSKMLSIAEDLVEFNWIDGPEAFGPWGMRSLDLPNINEPDSLGLLERLDLCGVSCGFHELRQFLTRFAGTLYHLELRSMALNDGYWVDMFHEIHSILGELSHVVLTGQLQEMVDSTDHTYPLWELGLVKSTEECLLLRVQDYLAHKTSIPPLLSTTRGGSPALWRSETEAQWQSGADRSLIYTGEHF